MVGDFFTDQAAFFISRLFFGTVSIPIFLHRSAYPSLPFFSTCIIFCCWAVGNVICYRTGTGSGQGPALPLQGSYLAIFSFCLFSAVCAASLFRPGTG